jgi:hypothetical protein
LTNSQRSIAVIAVTGALAVPSLAAAYAQLTAGCNICHQRYDRTAIVIQRLMAVGAFPDQDFRPPTK